MMLSGKSRLTHRALTGKLRKVLTDLGDLIDLNSRSPNHLPATPHDAPHIAIIGGGITGLSAAFYLERAAHDTSIPLRYTLVERDNRFGGKIMTDTVGDFVVEGGPDAFLAQKPWGVQLARDLGLAGQFMSTRPARHPTYVLSKGRPEPMPEGMSLVVPTRLLPFLRSPILSLRGKLRMALDLLIPPRQDDADETLADFIRRRLGSEALDQLAEPLLAGIHSAEPERQSILATFPRFRDLEAQHGSLIRGTLAQRRSVRSEGGSRSSILYPPSSAPGSSPFVTLRGGVGELVRALLEQLEGRLIGGHGVASLEYNPAAEQPYRLRLDDGEALDADAVILATPAFAAAEMVAPFQPALAAALRQIRYVSTGTITLAYRRGEIGEPLDGFGLIIPQRANRRINAVTITSSKFDGRAPAGYTLIRVFVGGSRSPDAVHLDDPALLALVRAELRETLGIAATPMWSRAYRWMHGNPQYDVGHLGRVDALEALLPPGIRLAGSAYRGVGIPDCVRQGQAAAEGALAFVRDRVTTIKIRLSEQFVEIGD
jgi:protoporphyrinogen/coproporphyrinogen III oxidase